MSDEITALRELLKERDLTIVELKKKIEELEDELLERVISPVEADISENKECTNSFASTGFLGHSRPLSVELD